jgi:hypothetical protein
LSFGAVVGLQEGEVSLRFDALGHDPRLMPIAMTALTMASPASPSMSCTNY